MKKLLIISLAMLTCFNSIAATFTAITNQGQTYLSLDISEEIGISTYYRLSSPLSAITYDYQPLFGENITAAFLSSLATTRGIVMDNWQNWRRTAPTGAVSSLRYESVTNFFIDAGLSSNGWRRAYSYDPATNDWTDFSDPMFTNTYEEDPISSGTYHRGEIFGPWLIDDLQKALDNMRYYISINTGDFVSRGTTNSFLTSRSSTNSYAEAKSLTVAAHPEFSYLSVLAPKAYGKLGDIEYNAQLLNRAAFYETPIPNTNSALFLLGGEIVFYGYATKPDARGENVFRFFDSNGFSYVAETNYVSFFTTNISAGVTNNIYSSMFGATNTIPNWPTSNPGTDELFISGYEITGKALLIKPNFPYTRE